MLASFQLNISALKPVYSLMHKSRPSGSAAVMLQLGAVCRVKALQKVPIKILNSVYSLMSMFMSSVTVLYTTRSALLTIVSILQMTVCVYAINITSYLTSL